MRFGEVFEVGISETKVVSLHVSEFPETDNELK